MPRGTCTQGDDYRRRKRPRTTAVVKDTSTIVDLSSTDEEDDLHNIMPIRTRSGQVQEDEGTARWRIDFEDLRIAWKNGEVEGYGGLTATIQGEFISTI